MEIRRDPGAISEYRRMLNQMGVLDRPAECLSDEEVIKRVEAIAAGLMKFAGELGKAMEKLTQTMGQAVASFAGLAEKLADAEALATVAEAERIAKEAS